MITRHEYTAVLLGDPERPLNVLGGEVSLDTASAPHVTMNLLISAPGYWDWVAGLPEWHPDEALLSALDPRQGRRIRVTATRTGGDATQTRTFNLGIRDIDIDRSENRVSLSLGGDEAILTDYAPLVDDFGAFTHQSSLRAVVNYVLSKAIPGATLAASPAVNADVRTYSTSTDLNDNPNAAVNLNGWSGAGIATLTRQTSASWAANAGQTAFRLYGSAGNANSYIQRLWTNGFAGRTILFRARVRNGGGMSNPGPNASRMHVYYSTDGAATFLQVGNVGGPTVSNGQADLSVVATIPSNATHAILRLYHGYGSADSVYWTDIQAREFAGDPTDTAYWDGSTPDTAAYRYDWTGAANASTPTRTALIDRPPDSLIWREGQSALDFLRPIVQAAGLRLVCDENRVWTLRDENYTPPGALTLRSGVNIISGNDSISRDSGLWFDARVTRYTWTDVQGVQQTRTDTFALPNYTRVSTLEINAPYPGPGRSEYAVRRAQGRGRDVSATTVSDWSVVAEQSLSLTLENTPVQLGSVTAVTFDLDTDTMTITARTADTPPGAIDLLTGTVNALSGTVNAL